jgi:integrative and conjugative element protein (TIGR02256 family)
MNKIKFQNKNLKVHINTQLKQQLLTLRQFEFDRERGGVILGKLYPQNDTIEITHFFEDNPLNSSEYGLELNVNYLQENIERIWEESNGQITYLGDWHTHPQLKAEPSLRDYKTFFVNYYQSKVQQNLLLYLILGRKENWFKSFNGLKFYEIKYLEE